MAEVLTETYALLKTEATRLAGEPHDIPQRAAILNYMFTKRHGGERGAEDVIRPELLEGLNSMHRAARAGTSFTTGERRAVFMTALEWEQELTVAPKVQEEIARFDCPILRTLVLKPIVRFAYFPRLQYMRFRSFANTDERIEKAVASYELAERAGWPVVIETMRSYRALPDIFFADRDAFVRNLVGR